MVASVLIWLWLCAAVIATPPLVIRKFAAARALIPPAEMFLAVHDAAFERTASYGTFDESGMPLTDADGEPLSKSARKKLGKARDKQAKAYDAAQKS